MKTIFKLAIMAAVPLFLLSCEGDDNKGDDEGKNPENNVIRIGTERHELQSEGALEDYGSISGAFAKNNTDVLLWTGDLSYDQQEAKYSGTGYEVYFEMSSTLGTALDQGTYLWADIEDYDKEDEKRIPVKRFTSDSRVSYFSNGSTQSQDYLIGGTVVVSKSGDTYTLTIDSTTRDGLGVKGKFAGNLKYCDYKK